MEWVKSKVGYYRHLAIATGSDALEVMFKRGDALAGELGTDGFIPDAMLPQLCRRPNQAKKLAEKLVESGLWDRVRGGYLIVDFASINSELVRLSQRKQRDRERKRAERAASSDASAEPSSDMSTDSPQPRPEDSLLDHQSKRKTPDKDAAAAALPPAVQILRAQLDARKLVVRWDTLTPDELADIERLAALHGDTTLIRSALASFQPAKPPATAKAWLGQWRDLRAPGDLALVAADPCPEPGHSGTTKHCAQCASEQKAANR